MTEELHPKLDVVQLPGNKFMIVLSGMPQLSSEDPRETARNWADWTLGRQQIIDGGASIVLRFAHPIEVRLLGTQEDTAGD